YPPDRHFDHLHMRLELEVPDMGKPAAAAVETLTVAAIGKPRRELVLDAGSDIKVESVTVNGKRRPFTDGDEVLTVTVAGREVVGGCAGVDVPAKDEARKPRDVAGGPLPVYLYAPLGTEKSAQRAYGNTPSMIAFFAGRFDEPYPWDKYAQALVRRFVWGGME